jgi:hypothetical protein
LKAFDPLHDRLAIEIRGKALLELGEIGSVDSVHGKPVLVFPRMGTEMAAGRASGSR